MTIKSLNTLCLLLFSVFVASAQELKSFKADNSKYGYKDQNGKVIIQPKYDFADYSFLNGFSKVRLDGKYGFINVTGKEVIPLKYLNATHFSDGLAAVQLEDQQWIYIEENNKTVLILPSYIYVSGIMTAFSSDMIFSEGLAPVRIHLSPYENFYNDVTRPEVRTRLIQELGLSADFTENDRKKLEQHLKPLIEQALTDPYRYSYIDNTGKLLFDPFKGYHIAKGFREGLAVVGNYVYGHTYLTMDPKYTFGFIDRNGKLVVAPKYEEARSFSEGLAAVKNKGLWGFINKEGKEVVPPQIGYVDDFKNGYAVVHHGKIEPEKPFNRFDKSNLSGLINKEGMMVVPIAHQYVFIDEKGIVASINDSLETKVHITAYEEFNKGHVAAQKNQYEQAVKHFLLSADKGYGAAMGNLGVLYASGAGVEKNLEKALAWMQKGAENNDLQSMLNLGLHYAQNQPQDFSKAFQWFKKASNKNYAPAMGHLALLFATGQGTTQNSEEALKWLNKGIVMGDAHCMFNSGLLHFQGVPGFEKNGLIARQWFEKAERAGHPQAKAALIELSKHGF